MISAVRGGEEVQIMGEVAVATVAVVTVAWTSRLVDRQALRPAGRLRSVSTVVTVAMRRPANDRLVIAADLVDVGCVAVLIPSAEAHSGVLFGQPINQADSAGFISSGLGPFLVHFLLFSYLKNEHKIFRIFELFAQISRLWPSPVSMISLDDV